MDGSSEDSEEDGSYTVCPLLWRSGKATCFLTCHRKKQSRKRKVMTYQTGHQVVRLSTITFAGNSIRTCHAWPKWFPLTSSGSSRNLATKTGLGAHFWQPKVVRRTCLGFHERTCFPRYMQTSEFSTQTLAKQVSFNFFSIYC